MLIRFAINLTINKLQRQFLSICSFFLVLEYFFITVSCTWHVHVSLNLYLFFGLINRNENLTRWQNQPKCNVNVSMQLHQSKYYPNLQLYLTICFYWPRKVCRRTIIIESYSLRYYPVQIKDFLKATGNSIKYINNLHVCLWKFVTVLILFHLHCL